MFIARVSRGRTVREFVICVLLIPSLVCLFWMAVFGGAAIDQVLSNPVESAVKANVIDSYSPELSLFAMLQGLPLSMITSVIAIVLVIVFFVTSSDSGSWLLIPLQLAANWTLSLCLNVCFGARSKVLWRLFSCSGVDWAPCKPW